MKNIHASCVVFRGKGVMFVGPSGSGKSSSCLRLITDENAILLADDRVDLRTEQGELVGSCPEQIAGLFEIYGVGIKSFPHIKEHKIDIVIELVEHVSQIERMPNSEFYEFEGIKIIKYKMLSSDVALLNKLKIIL